MRKTTVRKKMIKENDNRVMFLTIAFVNVTSYLVPTDVKNS
jgi:hypothetical protein